MSEWIKVEDRLPEISQEVLCFLGFYGNHPIYINGVWIPKLRVLRYDYLGNNKTAMFLNDDNYSFPVTHWMNIPPLPEFE